MSKQVLPELDSRTELSVLGYIEGKDLDEDDIARISGLSIRRRYTVFRSILTLGDAEPVAVFNSKVFYSASTKQCYCERACLSYHCDMDRPVRRDLKLLTYKVKCAKVLLTFSQLKAITKTQPNFIRRRTRNEHEMLFLGAVDCVGSLVSVSYPFADR